MENNNTLEKQIDHFLKNFKTSASKAMSDSEWSTGLIRSRSRLSMDITDSMELAGDY